MRKYKPQNKEIPLQIKIACMHSYLTPRSPVKIQTKSLGHTLKSHLLFIWNSNVKGHPILSFATWLHLIPLHPSIVFVSVCSPVNIPSLIGTFCSRLGPMIWDIILYYWKVINGALNNSSMANKDSWEEHPMPKTQPQQEDQVQGALGGGVRGRCSVAKLNQRIKLSKPRRVWMAHPRDQWFPNNLRVPRTVPGTSHRDETIPEKPDFRLLIFLTLFNHHSSAIAEFYLCFLLCLRKKGRQKKNHWLVSCFLGIFSLGQILGGEMIADILNLRFMVRMLIHRKPGSFGDQISKIDIPSGCWEA